MGKITNLSDQQLSSCIYKNCCTIEDLRYLLSLPGVVVNDIIDQDRFAEVFSDFYQDSQKPDNVSWAIPYFIADEIHKFI